MAEVPDLEEQGRKLLARCHKAATAYGRIDLADRVLQMLERIADDSQRVMMVGEFKHGKSSLLNALIGEELSPVDADIATSAPIVVRYGPERRALAVVDTEQGQGEVSFPVEELPLWATEGGNPGNHRHVRRVEVELPHPILEAGIAFVDTPGVGGLASTHGTITAAALPMADAVLFVSDAAQELSANELEFLQLVRRMCSTVAYVTTKIDMYPHWRRIVEIDGGHLDSRGIDLPRMAVSSTLRELADETDDAELADQSGFRPLVRWLGRTVARGGRRRTIDLVRTEVDQVVGQLSSKFQAERAALDAVDVSGLMSDLEAAKVRADALKGASSRWSAVLTDGFGDLSSDVDHDLRSRMRDLNRKVNDMIDGFDPNDAWSEFEPWLYTECGSVVSANYVELVERVRQLVEEVSDLFGAASDGATFAARVTAADELVAGTAVDARLDVARVGVVGQGLSILKGGYSSVGMFSMYAGMAGVVLSNPVSAAVALVMGGKGLRDERTRQLTQRRTQAKAAARRYIDEVNFVVGKDSRDTMRHLQRDLRAYFTQRAEESARSAAEAVAAAQSAVKGTQEERTARLADVEAELGRLTKLTDMATVLAEHAAGMVLAEHAAGMGLAEHAAAAGTSAQDPR